MYEKHDKVRLRETGELGTVVHVYPYKNEEAYEVDVYTRKGFLKLKSCDLIGVVDISVDIFEINSLIEANMRRYRSIPKESYQKYNALGTLGKKMKDVAAYYKQRARQLQDIRDSMWPK